MVVGGDEGYKKGHLDIFVKAWDQEKGSGGAGKMSPEHKAALELLIKVAARPQGVDIKGSPAEGKMDSLAEVTMLEGSA